ncbi:MAG TPA: phosphotransferase, partial [Polyangia bacterium]|nr:phosphotransferase [Polyangia bacterium]
ARRHHAADQGVVGAHRQHRHRGRYPYRLMNNNLDEEIRTRVLPRFPLSRAAKIAPFGSGLINQTFAVTTPTKERFVLQRVNPLFPAAIHANIRAVTDALVRAGLTTPLLIETNGGADCLELPGASAEDRPSVWRMLTFVDGVSFDVVASAAQARAAGALIARFHAAVEGLAHAFVGLRAGVHDTPRHLQTLRDALKEHANHPLHTEVLELGLRILDATATLEALPDVPARVGHGDLKFNNVLFAGATPPASEQAVCLVDLDTVGPQALAFELGDAWRSWCNRSGEDDPDARLDLEVFEASYDGYATALGRALSADERRALLLGPEWISVELAARFAADALRESYFGWDPKRFPTRGAHNLLRARGQWSLHEAFVATHARRTSVLGV